MVYVFSRSYLCACPLRLLLLHLSPHTRNRQPRIETPPSKKGNTGGGNMYTSKDGRIWFDGFKCLVHLVCDIFSISTSLREKTCGSSKLRCFHQ